MKTTRRSFFGFLGGAAATVVVAPKTIIYKSRSAGITTATEAQLTAHVAKGGFITPEVYANEFLKLLKEQLTIRNLSDGENG